MSRYSATPASAAQASALVAKGLAHQLATFLAPILRTLDQQLDHRLVSTFLATLVAIVQWRNRAHGLLLSELGACVLTPEQAPASTKRLSNLLRSPQWSASLIADWLWQQADTHVQTLRATGEDVLLVWDGSCWKSPRRPRMTTCMRFAPARRAWPALAGGACARAGGCAHGRGDAVVDKAWRAGE